MITIAFHGGYLNPEAMRRDMGNPEWVDLYWPVPPNGDDIEHLADKIWPMERVVLIGYSLGGSLIGHLTEYVSNHRIAGVVLYEAPLLGINKVSGDFPVLWIRNRYKAAPWREVEFLETLNIWQENHPVEVLTGEGRHVKYRWGFPPFGHAWDQSLNPMISNWIKNLKYS